MIFFNYFFLLDEKEKEKFDLKNKKKGNSIATETSCHQDKSIVSKLIPGLIIRELLFVCFCCFF